MKYIYCLGNLDENCFVGGGCSRQTRGCTMAIKGNKAIKGSAATLRATTGTAKATLKGHTKKVQ